MRNLIIISLLLISISSCCKKEDIPFYDKDVSNHGWALYEVKDANNNIIIEKPDSLPQDIYFFFTNDFKVIGHIASFKGSGIYTINNNKGFTMKFGGPKLPICCEWDQYFLDNQKSIYKYEYNSNQILTLYFENDSKFIFISK